MRLFVFPVTLRRVIRAFVAVWMLICHPSWHTWSRPPLLIQAKGLVSKVTMSCNALSCELPCARSLVSCVLGFCVGPAVAGFFLVAVVVCCSALVPGCFPVVCWFASWLCTVRVFSLLGSCGRASMSVLSIYVCR